MATPSLSISSSAGVSRQTKRIMSDLKDLIENPLQFISNLELSVEDGQNQITGVMLGSENTPYAGGHFRFVMKFPSQYPFKPTDFYYRTAICHPNIRTTDGVVCHDELLARWAPSISVRTQLTEMHSLLANPRYDTPVDNETMNSKTPEKAREWTLEFAKPLN